MKRRSGYNPKRRIAPIDALTSADRADLSKRCGYGGNPDHKRNPGDYGLTPPASPRPGKTLCDAAGSIMKNEAKGLLKRGIRKGMVSQRQSNGWPQNVWAVSNAGDAFEAQLENPGNGTYHGYPMPVDDDFRAKVVKEWQQR